MKLLTLFLILFSCTTHAAGLWTILPQKTVDVKGKRTIIPQKYILIKLNDSLLQAIQVKTPKEGSEDFTTLELPTPGGNTLTFRMTETSNMAPELAAKYPELKTYKAIEISNPVVFAKTDYTAFGFHAMVYDGDNTYFIDPYSNVRSNYYLCYYKRDYDKPSTEKLSELPVKKKCCKHHCRKK